MIRINVTICVKPENRAQIIGILCELAGYSGKEKGCLGYRILEDTINQTILMIHETWANSDVLAVHEQTEHFARLVPAVKELAESMTIEKFSDAPSVSEAILYRRSVREFSTDKIPMETTERILKAAMYAPSANNRRPWEFLLVEDQTHLEALSRMSPYGQPLAKAPLAIIICCNTQEAGLDGVFWTQDLGACTQNLMLQAYAEGLGAVWVRFYPKINRVHLIKEHFSLPTHFVPFAVIAIGKPVQTDHEIPNRFETQKIHFIHSK